MSIYLDYAATTPIREEVLQNYVEYLRELGNPSSVHSDGQSVRRALEEARESLAKSIGCNRSEVIFTSGGTEADNLAIKGIYWQRNQEENNRTVLISVATEHHAVLDTIEWLEQHEGAKALWLPVDVDGVIDYQYLEDYLAENHESVALISIMLANNETGLIHDIRRITKTANQFGIPVHSDAVSAFGHIPFSFQDSGLASVSVSAHKLGGPIGIGALIVARSAKLVSLIHGGGQERGLRSGTMNAPAAKAFAQAAEIAVSELDAESVRLTRLRDELINAVLSAAPNAKLTGKRENRIPNNTHFIFEGCSGESLLFLLDQQGFSVSVGSACQAGVNGPSHVLIAMGRDEFAARGCLRMTIGNKTTSEEIHAFAKALPAAVEQALKAGFPVGGNS
ncbi:MAG: cysteine desulfurase [Micrococcales bacterium]|nr:cysteine desulfurase [Micrococcales bacterium]